HFRELLSNTNKDKTLWKTICKQFNDKGIKVKNGMIQDATFITSDPSHGNYKKDKKDTMKYLN
ncbi:MAG: IS5/IS1182 family transposase, partial [Nitrososphaeria archaeon]